MGKVIMMPGVWLKLFLFLLEEELYKKVYFGFKESAKAYIDAIIDFAYTIPDQRRHLTKQPSRGPYYCRWSPNRKTNYFFVFDTQDNIYLIRDIFTNHSEDYPIFIRG
jgi:hypothetical protein